MLFLARMDVHFPESLTPEQVADFQAREKEYSGNLQREGKMKGIWRVVGEYANYSIYDVENNDELQQVMAGFPMFKYMNVKITPLAEHPNHTDAVAY
ncbi:muconolactone Delta-isomerase [Corynebacterium halotolerans]|uniref:Muconolactone Delta-isomerase n=1 Tax=Corynebacterium halotolerans YIM 70093 = DSM 44683 TaxID=1121362 RepID=M1NRR9_9CORY|nr:muconolactone Delta-isomerase [Corynebacterium halotolerans]AGF72202.1 muconolactone Delta-isomerase [Corynebacterium halotolerans YIM 70093 = DSM 44683]